MLKKLIKYDLIWINKFMTIFFIISLIISTLTRIASYTDSFLGNILYIVLKGATTSTIVSILINCAIRIWVRFRQNIYKDESYLTHTLPVSKNTLYNSKIISSLISIIISLSVVLISILIVYLDQNMIEKIKTIFNDNNTTQIFINILIISILEILYMVYCGIMGIQLGHKSNNNKMLKSVFIGIGLYFIMQIVMFVIVFSIGLINKDINTLFTNTINTDIKLETAVKTLVLIVNIVYITFITVMYFIGKKLFKKGVNVE